MSGPRPSTPGSAATLLLSLQLGDSALPTGGYTLSHGLEAAVEIGRVRDVADAEEYLRVLLEGVVGPTDLVAVVNAARAAQDLAEVIAIDRALNARKLAREPREASRRAGRAMLAIAEVLVRIPSPDASPRTEREHTSLIAGEIAGGVRRPIDRSGSPGNGVPERLLAAYADAIRRGDAPGTHAVVFGCVARWLGLTAEAAACVYLHGFLVSFAGALGRLLPIDHLQVQALVRRGHAVAVPVIDRAVETPWWDMASSAPEAELLSLVHERSLMRAFAT